MHRITAASKNNSPEGDGSQRNPVPITSLLHKISHVIEALINYPSTMTGKSNFMNTYSHKYYVIRSKIL